MTQLLSTILNSSKDVDFSWGSGEKSESKSLSGQSFTQFFTNKVEASQEESSTALEKDSTKLDQNEAVKKNAENNAKDKGKANSTGQPLAIKSQNNAVSLNEQGQDVIDLAFLRATYPEIEQLYSTMPKELQQVLTHFVEGESPVGDELNIEQLQALQTKLQELAGSAPILMDNKLDLNDNKEYQKAIIDGDEVKQGQIKLQGLSQIVAQEVKQVIDGQYLEQLMAQSSVPKISVHSDPSFIKNLSLDAKSNPEIKQAIEIDALFANKDFKITGSGSVHQSLAMEKMVKLLESSSSELTGSLKAATPVTTPINSPVTTDDVVKESAYFKALSNNNKGSLQPVEPSNLNQVKFSNEGLISHGGKVNTQVELDTGKLNQEESKVVKAVVQSVLPTGSEAKQEAGYKSSLSSPKSINLNTDITPTGNGIIAKSDSMASQINKEVVDSIEKKIAPVNVKAQPERQIQQEDINSQAQATKQSKSEVLASSSATHLSAEQIKQVVVKTDLNTQQVSPKIIEELSFNNKEQVMNKGQQEVLVNADATLAKEFKVTTGLIDKVVDVTSLDKAHVDTTNKVPVQPVSLLGTADGTMTQQALSQFEATVAKMIESGIEKTEAVNKAMDVANVTRKDLPDVMKEKVMMMVNLRIRQVDIRLDPPEMGSMQVRLNMQPEHAQVNFVVQNQQVQQSIEQHIPRLREMLQEQGVNLGETSVKQEQQAQKDFSQGEQQQQGQMAGEQETALTEDESQQIGLNLDNSSPSGVDYYV